MSGHHTNGRIGQSNPSQWNLLHVPSYIPRKPQLAHLQNDRTLHTSPLMWHPQSHTDSSIFNYMSSHKSATDIVLGNKALYGSVDLSKPPMAHHITPSFLMKDSASIPENPFLSRLPTTSTPEKLQQNLAGVSAAAEAALPNPNLLAHDHERNFFQKYQELLPAPPLNAKDFIEQALKNDSNHLLPNPTISELYTNNVQMKPIPDDSNVPPPPYSSTLDYSNKLAKEPSSSGGGGCAGGGTMQNDDSLDSSSEKKRNRRKPNKTNRMSIEKCSLPENILDSVRCIDQNDKLHNTIESPLGKSVAVDKETTDHTTIIPTPLVSQENIQDLIVPNVDTSVLLANRTEEVEPGSVTADTVPVNGPPTEAIEKIITELPETLPDLPQPTGSTAPIIETPVTEPCFEDVENKLEEMFAGIEDDRSLPTSMIYDVPISSTPIKEITSDAEVKCKRPEETRKKIQKKNLKKRKQTKPGKMSRTALAKEKKANKTKSSVELLPATAAIETKYRGPYVQMKLDGSSSVINAPLCEEVAENKMKVKKTFVSQTINDRSKIRGLHVSTLSTKYDADTTDKTWICVFCKMGPHKFGLGDLFGPYVITTASEDFKLSQSDPQAERNERNNAKQSMLKRQTAAVAALKNVNNLNNKKKRKLNTPECLDETLNENSVQPPVTTNPELFYGMIEVTDGRYEVWLHEDCAVWSSGVHLIGAQIIGLDAAVWSSCQYKCQICQNYGAMLSCLHRGCRDVCHVPCARNSNWFLREIVFKTFCDKHQSDADKLPKLT